MSNVFYIFFGGIYYEISIILRSQNVSSCKQNICFVDYHVYVPNKMLKKLMMINSARAFYNNLFKL